MGANELGVRDAGVVSHRVQDLLVEVHEVALEPRAAFEQAGHENTAALGYFERWRAVGTGDGMDHSPLEPDGIDVHYIAGGEVFEQVIGLVVAELVDMVPDLLGLVTLLDAESA